MQERILMYLPLHELERGVWLGKAFWSALKQRWSKAEKILTLTAPAIYGKALLAGVALVLRRYQQRVNLLTGCGPMPLNQSVGVDERGAVIAKRKRWGSRPHAEIQLCLVAPFKLQVELVDGYRLGGKLTLDVRPHPSSPQHSFAAARLVVSPGFSMQYSKHLSAFFLIAQMVGEGSRCNTSLEAPQRSCDACAPPVGANRVQDEPQDVIAIRFPVPLELRKLAEALPPVLDPPESPRDVKVLMRAVPVELQKMSREVVDHGIMTAVMLGVGLNVPCCHLSLSSIAIVGSCLDGYCGKRTLPS
jgi:hypothetical protein